MVDDERNGVRLTSLDQPLGDDLEVTKGNLVDYLDAVADRLVPLLAGRPLSVKRVRPGQAPFMQRNVSKGAPDWVRRVEVPRGTPRRCMTVASAARASASAAASFACLASVMASVSGFWAWSYLACSMRQVPRLRSVSSLAGDCPASSLP